MIDFFGVISSEVSAVWLEKHFNKDKTALLKEKYFRPLDLGKIQESALIDTLSTLANISSERVNQDFKNLVKINPLVIATLQECKEKYTIVLCSNANSDFLRNILKENVLEQLFDTIIISSEIGLAKPDKKFFIEALKLIDEKAENVIFIDDNPKNIEGAQNLGIESHIFHDPLDLEFLRK
jgi:HAD superfamily hydrolase (TIGR01509 family)